MSEYFSTSGTKLSAEMQEAILAATPNMMVIFDDSYHLVGLHNPILEHIPYPPEEMVGKTLEELIEEPESRNHFHEQLQKTREGKTPRYFDIYLPVKNTKYFFDVHTALLPNNQVIAFMRDITDYTLRKTETEKLQLFLSRVLESIEFPISIKDMNTERYIFWSERSSIFGRTAEGDDREPRKNGSRPKNKLERCKNSTGNLPRKKHLTKGPKNSSSPTVKNTRC